MTDDDRERIEFDYAWGWFQYHASQRLTAFNFFLVIVGFLLVGYAQAVDHRWVLFGVVLGIFGAIVALAFLVLDIRNEELVLLGRDALQGLEKREGMVFSLADPEPRSTLSEAIAVKRKKEQAENREGEQAEKESKAALVVKHKVWLRLIIFLAGVGFSAAAVWALTDYSGSGSDPVACRESTVFVLHRPGLDLNLVRRSEGEDANAAGKGDGSTQPSQSSSGETQIGSKAGTESKLTEGGSNCDAKSTGGDSPQP